MDTMVARTTDLAPVGPRRLRLAWLPVPVLFLLVALAAWVNPGTSFQPRFLLPALNIVFITGVCLLVAGLAASSYSTGQSQAVLFVGGGALAFAGGSTVAATGVLLSFAPDVYETAYSVAALLAGACYLGAATSVFAGARAPDVSPTRRRRAVVVTYLAILLSVALVTVCDFYDLLPAFFVPGTGSTEARRWVLAAAVTTFATTAGLFQVLQRRSPSGFIDRFSIGLVLIALGLAGGFGEHALDSVLGWTARAAQYCGCIYIFAAVVSLPGGSRSWRISLDRTLRETERRHQSLVDVCPDAILVHAGGRYVFANPAAARLFGAPSPAAVVGRDVLELIHPGFRPLAAGRIEEARGGGITPLQEMQFLRLDGSPIDVEVTGTAVEFHGQPAIQTVVRDVSLRKRAEAALRLHSDFAAEVLTAPDPQAIFSLLADRIYVIARPAMVAVSEFDPHTRKVIVRSVRCTDAEREVAKASFGRDPEGLSLDFHEETRARWVAGELAVVPGGLFQLLFEQVPPAVCDRLAAQLGLGDVFGMACAHDQDILGTVAVLSKDRGRLADQKSIESLVGSAALALKRARADEARQRMERDLRASEGLLRAVTDHTTDAVYVKDQDSRWLMANPALLRITRRSADEVLGRSDVEIYADPRIGEAIVANDRKVLASGAPMVFEEAAETPEGVRWFLSTKAPMRDRSGQTIGLIGISRDITERRRMEEALRESDRRKDEFIAMLSHELRNPLAPIRYALPLIDTDSLPETAGRAVSVIARQVDHLVRLVDDLLDVSRITRGRIELRPEVVTLRSVVERAIESASPLIESAGHRLEVRLPDETVWMDADPHRVSQIITNLLTNAAKYTPPGGRIDLEAGCDDQQAVIRVADNGIGIPAEALPTVFEMFYQVDRPDKAAGGLGIGLALSRRLAEMHGGSIEARSEGVGTGAEFVVRLPAAPEPRRPPQATADAFRAEPAARTLKVLIVDDNRDLVEMLGRVVACAGHEVRHALDGWTALAVARSYRPDVVLLDLGLPGISGLEVGRRLRAQAETASARLVALTGWGQPDDRRDTTDAGFDYHLTKPTDADTLEHLLAGFAAEAGI